MDISKLTQKSQEALTAAQTQAITFGNMRDAESAVTKKGNEPARAYRSLMVLNTRPAITYLAQVNREADERSHG